MKVFVRTVSENIIDIDDKFLALFKDDEELEEENLVREDLQEEMLQEIEEKRSLYDLCGEIYSVNDENDIEPLFEL